MRYSYCLVRKLVHDEFYLGLLSGVCLVLGRSALHVLLSEALLLPTHCRQLACLTAVIARRGRLNLISAF